MAFARLCKTVLAFGLMSFGLNAQQLATLQITSRTPAGPSVPNDFLGLSLQQSAALTFFGPSTGANTVLFTLMKNLGAGTLRIGGSAADYSCWNGQPAPAPQLCQYTLTSADFDSWTYASGQTNWPMIVGVSLAQNIAPGAPQYVVNEITHGLMPMMTKHPKASLLGIELGNEINLYYTNPAYRPPNYGIPGQTSDLLSYATAFKANASTANLTLVAPAYYDPTVATVASQLVPLISGVLQCNTCSASNLGLVTLHEYPLNTNHGTVTVASLLAPSLISQIESTFHTAVTSMATPFKLNVQIDETNSTLPDPGLTGVDDVQASALWALDYALDMARIGVRRMNFHIHQGSFYDPIVVAGGPGNFTNQIQPEYYGMYAFQGAIGKQFLPSTLTTSANVRAYALSSCSTCPITIFLINKDPSAFGTVQVCVPLPVSTSATYYELSAPSLTSPTGTVSIGGVQFSPTTGLLNAATQTIPLTPDINGNYTITLDNAAAGILTIQP